MEYSVHLHCRTNQQWNMLKCNRTSDHYFEASEVAGVEEVATKIQRSCGPCSKIAQVLPCLLFPLILLKMKN